MKQDVKNYIKVCNDCQKCKLIHEKTKATMLIIDHQKKHFKKLQ